MKGEFIVRMGREVVAYVDVLRTGYLANFKDGRGIPATSLQEYRDAGYTVDVRLVRNQEPSGNLREDAGNDT